ncbi:hypothetical protein CSB11_02965 [Candidatus Campbellbacteria bacterium]|nr:MAG: hypothetical protein CSB11_02965 [Candidatus Campbellbacteria bacterium]
MKKNFKKYIIFILLIFGTFQSLQALELSCKDYGKIELSQDQYRQVVAICDAEIAKDQQEYQKKKAQTGNVKVEIQKLDQKIKISQAYINRKIARANLLNRNINETKDDISELESDLDKIVDSLKKLFFWQYQLENRNRFEALLSTKTLSEYFQDVRTIEYIQETIAKEVKEMKDKKVSLERLTFELEEKESVERQLASEKKIEKSKIDQNKKYKNELLNVLKKEEGSIKVSIQQKQRTKNAILQKLYTLASGQKVTFGEAYNILAPYEKRFKMDTAFVLSILFQESGHMGRIGGNIGQCYYNQKNSHGNPRGGYQVMKNTQQVAFKQIMAGLGVDPATQKISCPIPRDGSYGGAMGPAQFMPQTWLGIRKQAAAILGKSPAKMSPFTNHDAFIASASLLKSNYYSKSCSNYANKNKHIMSVRTLREKCAAAMYYAGGNWFKYRNKYGQSVVNRANRFRADIEILKS